MAAPQVIPPHLQIDDFQPQITHMKRDGHTYNQVLAWLKEQGIHTSITTLKRRLQTWGIREHTEVEISDALAERVNWLFHHTLYDDSQIAIKITEEVGLKVSAS
jgi:hypothetical protein